MTDLVMHPSIAADKIVPPDRLASDVLRRQGAERPDGIAWITPTRRWTFAEANVTTNRIAQGLLSLGIARGDRVACLTRYGAECTLLIDAASRIGAVCAPLNWRLAAPEAAYVIGHSEARFVMVDREFLPLLQGQKLPLVLTDGAQDEHQGFHELSFFICEKFL